MARSARSEEASEEPAAYEGLARRYRPQTFDDVVGQRHVVHTLVKAVTQKRWASAYLFVGGRGLGKTTMARLLAKAINCEKGPTAKPCCSCAICSDIAAGRDIDVQEIDAASNTGVDHVRDTIIQAVATSPARSRARIFIIDEVHMLSGGAFNALLKTIEEPPPNVVFILATTEARKVPPTIRSRCQRFDFRPLSTEELSSRLKMIAEREKITVDADALALLCDYAEGGVRDALSALDLVRAFAADKVTLAAAEEALGVVSSSAIAGLVDRIAAGDPQALLAELATMMDAGAESGEVMRGLLNAFRRMLIDEVEGRAVSFSRARIMRSLDAILESGRRAQISRHARLELELLLCRLGEFKREETSIREIYDRLVELETSGPPAVPRNPAKPESPKTAVRVGTFDTTAFLKALAAESTLAGTLLEGARLALDDDTLTITLDKPFAYDRIGKDDAIRATIAKCLESSAGRRIAVAYALEETRAPKPEAQPEKISPKGKTSKLDPKTQEEADKIAKLFGAKIVGIE